MKLGYFNTKNGNSSNFDDFPKVLPEHGLTTEQVKKLTNLGFSNVVKNTSYKSVWQIIFDNVFTFFNLIFCVLSVLLLLVHSYKDMFFMFVVVANTLIGIVQQIRSKIKLDKLNLISAIKVDVIRDGVRKEIFNSEIVKGDIIILKTGDQITVDAVVLRGSVQIDESLLTGESDPISKTIESELLSGSFVLSGSCLARVISVGNSCYANKLMLEAKKHAKSVSSEIFKSLDSLIKLIGVVLIPIGFFMFFKETLILHHDYIKAIQALAALLVGMIPEGLYLLTSLALAMSVLKLIESKTLVHEVGCIEALARVDVLCVDKTGTITHPKMEVVDVIFNSVNLQNEFSKEFIENVLDAVVFNMPADSETAIALKKKFKTETNSNFKVIKVYEFLSSTKWFAVEFEKQGLFMLGAPEFIMRENYHFIAKEVEEFALDGKRVLLLAKVDGFIEKCKINGKSKPLCFVLIENPVRSTAKQTFEFFKKQGVKIKVFSGDNPVAVSSICKKVNLQDADDYIDASKLENELEIEQALQKATVFGRVSPEQKKKFIQILQKKGKHTVAMAGDGVNDVLALRQANVGVAMASGSSAASQAAEIVLLNSNFDAMPKIVFEGRRVINNIERSASLFLVKNIFSFGFAILTMFFKIGFPITPFQLTCVSFFTIGMPSFLLTLENNASLIRGKFLNNIVKKALPGGICNIITVVLVRFVAKYFNFYDSEISAFCVVMLAFNGLLILLEQCKPLNWMRGFIFGLVAILMAGSLGFLIFSKNISYFDFFSNYFVFILLLVFGTISYFLLKCLIKIFNLKLVTKMAVVFKKLYLKFVDSLKF